MLLSPPYDVISKAERAELVGAEHNVVRIILPGPAEAAIGDGDPYAGAAQLVQTWVTDGTLASDDSPALYVYEMAGPDGSVTRGLLGAVELRDPDDGVILPHENTMAGPVADRLALMTATQANLEPIYLVYDGGGATSSAVARVSDRPPNVEARTPDGVTHRLWMLNDPAEQQEIARDLSSRRALIADGHHRYATYLRLQAEHDGQPGPWDRGLTLLVDTSSYGPQVHAIHRVVAASFAELVTLSQRAGRLSEAMTVGAALTALAAADEFAVILVGPDHAVLLTDLDPAILRRGLGVDADTPLGRLDVTVLHRVLVEQVWSMVDDEQSVGYEHDVAAAVGAVDAGHTAVLLRATPVEAVAAVAAAGSRMPRKSTLFTPKPASGMVLRRFVDQLDF
ncbi:MAG: hypothetical protein JWN95_272 [Frankiales bacterium]|nr:hypothetical protein [Frankiales bacterium]